MAADEQLGAELLFQIIHLRRHRRLCDQYLACDLGDALIFGSGDKDGRR